MTGEAGLAREFEAQRPRLPRLAYATTGSLAEAGDCVQEAWLRLHRAAGREPIRDLGGWLTTAVSAPGGTSRASGRGSRPPARSSANCSTRSPGPAQTATWNGW